MTIENVKYSSLKRINDGILVHIFDDNFYLKSRYDPRFDLLFNINMKDVTFIELKSTTIKILLEINDIQIPINSFKMYSGIKNSGYIDNKVIYYLNVDKSLIDLIESLLIETKEITFIHLDYKDIVNGKLNNILN